MIKAVIFDCFGVLTQDGWLSFCNKYMTRENEENLRYINHQADRGLVEYEEFLSRVCELTGAPRDEAHAEITTTHTPNEPVFEIVTNLKKNGYILGVISNVGDELSNFLPAQYVDLFDEITLSYHVHTIKPEPEIYQYHLKQLGIQPDEGVFIDDRKANAAGATAIGMVGIFYHDPSSLKSELASLGVNLN
jgi:HAD superfamily hydrolase (TIGR01509 family)